MADLKAIVVGQGDYLTKLAWQHGFDAAAVWADPRNADLAAKREHMDILLPGDILFVPDRPPPEGLPIEKGKTNRYIAKVPKVKVAFTLRDGGKVLANERYVITGLGAALEGTTDGEGRLAVEASVHTREMVISLPDQKVVFPVRLGDMDPISEPEGARKRLLNLGYYRPPSLTDRSGNAADEDPLALALRLAIVRFQEAHGLPATGTLDAPTRKELLGQHGS